MVPQEVVQGLSKKLYAGVLKKKILDILFIVTKKVVSQRTVLF